MSYYCRVIKNCTMPYYTEIVGYYLRAVLFILLSLIKCSNSNNSELERKLQRTDVNDNMNSVNSNHDSVLELVKTRENNSLSDTDLKDTVPVWPNKVNSTTVMEGFTLFVGLSIAIVLYFTIKAIRLRRRRCRVRKYGLLTSQEDVVEMTPLGEEEDDEDSTVFDISDHPRSSSRP